MRREGGRSRAVRGLGLGVLLMTLLPLGGAFREASGPGIDQFVAWGTTLAAPIGLTLAATLLLGGLLIPVARRLPVGRPPAGSPPPLKDGVAAAAALAAVAGAWLFSHWALAAGPHLVDGMTQLVQGRLFAAGRVALASDAPAAFFHFQYLAASSRGWTSQYPPGFALLLALGFTVGLVGLVGPALHGLTAWLGVRLVRRLFPADGVLLLAGAALLALSPFALALAGSYMNHGAAALLGLLAVASGLRWTGRGRHGWAAAAGAALGGLATVRPLSALSLGVVVAALPWLVGEPPPGPPGPRRAVGWLVGLVGGSLLPLGGLLLYNQILFGGPLAFGYLVAQGPSHELGFHVDPWGARYTPALALAYAATELRALGPELAGAPLPLTVVVGAVAALSPRPAGRVLLVLLWALAPVVAGFFYWHHDLSMGPRLLADTAPAWATATAWAVSRLWSWPDGASGMDPGRPGWRTVFLRGVVLAAGAVALTGTPLRLARYGGGAAAAAGGVDADPGSLVFVHDAWSARIGSRLAGRGARMDVLRRLHRLYTTCELQRFLDATEAGGGSSRLPPAADEPGAPPPRRLVERRMPSGSVVVTYPGEVLDPACRREAGSDFRGIVALPRYLWRGDLPGAERGAAMFARDMGPVRNHHLLQAYPERGAWVLVRQESGPPMLIPYEEGTRVLWSGGTDVEALDRRAPIENPFFVSSAASPTTHRSQPREDGRRFP